MRIKASPEKKRRRQLFKGWVGKILGVLILCFLLVAAFATGVVLQDKSIIGKYIYNSQYNKNQTAIHSVLHAKNNGKALINWVTTPFHKRPAPIHLNIKHKHLQKLRFKQAEASQEPILISSPDDFIPATIEFETQSIRGDIRLKGDWTHHIRGSQWSFRVKLKGDDTLNGVKNFSLHAPRHRHHLFEWAFHKALNREGLIALRYNFHELFINGESYGIYAFEEHFGKRLIENNRRREGPILKFDESGFWEQHKTLGTWDVSFFGDHRSQSVFQSSRVDSFQSSRLLSTPEGRNAYAKGVGLLEGFRAGTLKTSKVFDIEQLARFCALVDLFGADHGFAWQNCRFYLNPITGRLEPIGFDSNSGPLKKLSHFGGDVFAKRLFKDSQLIRIYTRELERISSPEYIETFFKEFERELSIHEKHIQISEPGYAFERQILRENSRRIRMSIHPANPLRILLQNENEATPVLKVANIQPFAIEVLGIVNGTTTRLLEQPRILQPVPADQPLLFIDLPVPGILPADTDPGTLHVKCRILGCEDILEDSADGRWHRKESLLKDPARTTPTAHKFPKMLTHDAGKRIIHLNPGNWTLNETLILPVGHTLEAKQPVTLDFCDNASLVAFGPVHIRGTPENPVRFISSDGTGGGIAILDARDPSTIRDVLFDNLANPVAEGWSLTGAVTFYKSPVTIENTTIRKSRCEDALNIFDSHFTLRKIRIEETFADGFDGDFSDGTIDDSLFANIGNDAIDISGGKVRVIATRIVNAGDKGVSAGESSSLEIQDIQVKGALIGIAAKDSSRLQIHGSSLRHCKYNFAAYQKKSEYGPGFIQATKVVMEDFGATHVLEEESSIIVDQERLSFNVKDAVVHLYGSAP